MRPPSPVKQSDTTAGMDELGRDGRGQREAHGGEAVRDQELSGLERVPVGRGLEHVRARVHRGDAARRGQLARDLGHPVRGEPGHRDLQGARALAADAVHLGHVPVRLDVPAHDARGQVLEDRAQVADHLERGREVGTAARRAPPRLARGPAREAQHRRGVGPAARDQLHRVEAEGDDEVRAPHQRLLQRPAREDPHRQRMRVGDRALGLVGRQHRRGQRLAERAQPLGVGGAAAQPRDDERPLGDPDHLGGALDEGIVGRRQRRRRHRGGHRHRRRAGHVRGEVQVHGPARLRERELYRVGHPVARRVRRHRHAALHDGPQVRGVIEILMRGVGEHARRVAIADVEQRRAVELRVGQAGGARGDAGTERGEDGPRPAGELAGHRGHDGRGPLLVAEDEGQATGARGLEDFQIGSTARHAEEARDLGPEQPLDDQLGDGGHRANRLRAGEPRQHRLHPRERLAQVGLGARVREPQVPFPVLAEGGAAQHGHARLAAAASPPPRSRAA